mmetsp:Transcript_2360/g.5809  ORF Transcript_2360/g.5809 Transcript_2360/m.5809 type:complete len:234 (+) Transcript_2360:477-1178(+)
MRHCTRAILWGTWRRCSGRRCSGGTASFTQHSSPPTGPRYLCGCAGARWRGRARHSRRRTCSARSSISPASLTRLRARRLAGRSSFRKMAGCRTSRRRPTCGRRRTRTRKKTSTTRPRSCARTRRANGWRRAQTTRGTCAASRCAARPWGRTMQGGATGPWTASIATWPSRRASRAALRPREARRWTGRMRSMGGKGGGCLRPRSRGGSLPRRLSGARSRRIWRRGARRSGVC